MTVQSNRRTVLINGSVFFALPVGAAFSGDGGGAKDGGTSSPDVWVRGGIKEKYTQKEFARLSKQELDLIWQNVDHDGSPTTVEGFSREMTESLINMMFSVPRRTRTLMRDMGTLTGHKPRYARLADEKDQIDRRIAKLKAALKRAKAKKRKHVINETQTRIGNAEIYREGLTFWIPTPREGTY